MKIWELAVILVIMFFSIAKFYSDDGVNSVEDKIIKGTADFLVDRANANFLYIFEKDLKNEPSFQIISQIHWIC